jgi:hypothetical protein
MMTFSARLIAFSSKCHVRGALVAAGSKPPNHMRENGAQFAAVLRGGYLNQPLGPLDDVATPEIGGTVLGDNHIDVGAW